MNNYIKISFVFYMLLLIFIIPKVFCQESSNMKLAPLNPAFLKFQQKLNQQKKRTKAGRTSTNELSSLGLIPDPSIPEKHQPALEDSSDIPDIPLYDLRDPNNDGNLNDSLLTPVRDQMTCGACWSFATFGTLESFLKKTQNLSDNINDFSENHLRHMHNFDLNSCIGGNMKMSAAYFLANKGPVFETDDPYDPLTNEHCINCSPQRYVDSVIFMPIRFDINDIGYIKRVIYQHGGIYSSIYFDENRFFQTEQSTYYYDDPDDSFNDSNHAIVIVGWDDNKHIPNAPDKGAFIVRNSFGPAWGDNGYFYVSYYDESIGFTKLGYFIDIEDHLFSFKNIYQYDDLGWTGAIGTGDGDDWAANVFVANENIELTGIGFYTTGSNMTCSINLYQQMLDENGYASLSDQLLDHPISYTFVHSGYYIISLNKPIFISSGKSFVAVINYIGSRNSYAIPIETPILGYTSKATSKPGQSYVSDDGKLFFDLNDLSPNSNNCIKAYVIPFVDSPPVAISKEIQTKEDYEVAIKLSGTDKSNKDLNYLVLTYPLHGLLSGSLPDLIYTPDPNYHGTDGFDFIVNNGTESSESAHITINIISVNDPPKPNYTNIIINEDESFSLSTIASDPDGDFVYCYIRKAPINGSISSIFPERTYTPDTNFFGEDSFSFYLNDGKSTTDTMRMNITVEPINDQPIVFDQYITLSEDSQKQIVLTGTDIENDHLNFFIVTHPSHGGISGVPPNLIYAPNPNYSGTDVFTYQANDGLMDSNLANCHITIKPSDDQPTANDMTVTLKEGQPVLFSLSGADPENSPLTYIIKSSPDHGQITGTLPDLIYFPNKGFHGQDYLTYQVNDGKQLSEIAIINLIVKPDNSPPVVENITLFLTENTTKSLTLVGTDPNNNSLTFSILTHPDHGAIKGILPNIIYAPDLNYSGVDRFTYSAFDGYEQSEPGQVLIFIKHVNYPPEANPGRIITSINTAKSFYLRASDQNNDSLEYLIVSNPEHGQLTGDFPFVTYTPDYNFTGVDFFSFQASDGQVYSNKAEISILVTEFNIVTDIVDIDTTAQTILTEDFEGDTSAWTFGTGGQTNKWFKGTAVSYSGTTSAYISHDGGANATYDETTASESWLTRTVDLTDYIDATLSFYWQSMGEETLFVWYDYGEFYVNNGADVLISASKEFVDTTSWTHKEFDISEYAGDTIDLKFKWLNDGSVTDGNPAFCVDNIEITGSQMKPGAGNALDFDGDNDYVALSNVDAIVSAASLGMPATITVEAWVKVDTFSDWAGFIGFMHDDGALEGGWILGVMANNKFYFGITTLDGLDYEYYLETDSNYLTNTWYHVAGTYDGDTMRIYVNGVEVASLQPDHDGDIRYRDTYYVIGAYRDESEIHEFDGQIDEIRVWNGARTANDIRANMCKKLDPDMEPNLLDYYPLDHSQGNFVDDYKGGNNNGTLTNMNSNEDWITSGAAIGDSTIFDYSGASPDDFQVNLSHGDGDQLTVTGESGHYTGIHLYLVNEPPVNTTPPEGWNPLNDGHYWGVFPVGDNVSFTVEYNYDGLPGIVAEMDLNIASRDNATKAWGETSSVTLDTDISLIETSGTSPVEYISGEKSAPYISDIDDQNTPYKDILFLIEDSEGGDITIVASSTDLSLVTLSDIGLSCSDSYSCVIDTTASVEEDITLTIVPTNNEHGKVTIELLATDSDGLTSLNSFTVIVSPSASGNALSFNGTDEFVNIGDINLVNKSFTIEFWAKRTAHAPEYRCVLGQGSALTNNQLFVGFRSEKFRVDFYDNDLDTTDNFPDLEWHHWAMSYKDTTNDWTLYRDGKVVETGIATDDYQGTGDMIIGQWADDGQYFKGELDELRIWNGIRTKWEIRETMCKKLTGNEEELVAYYRFDHESGTQLIDLTDNDHNGSLNNMDNTNWISSGALLGSESNYDYTGAVATDFNTSVSHSDGDSFSVTGTSGSFEGIQVYQVEGPPNHENTNEDCSAIDENRHWGVFPVGSGNIPVDIFYEYTGNPIATEEDSLKIYARDDHADSEWTALTATQNLAANTFYKSGITACEFLLGVTNHIPEISQGDAVSTIIDKNCWPREWDAPTIEASDADSDSLTWSTHTGPGHGIVVVTGNGASPEISYTPTVDFIGYDSFVIQVEDGHDGGVDTITINVTVKSGIHSGNLPLTGSAGGGSAELQDTEKNIKLFYMGPGRMIMPKMKIK